MKRALSAKPLAILIASLVLLLSLATFSLAQDEGASPLDVSLTAQDVRGIVVAAGTTGGVIPLLADPGTQGGDILDVVTTNASASVSLVLPGGAEINSNNAASQGFTCHVLPDGAMTGSPIPSVFSTPGTHTVIKFPAASAPGTYQVKIVSPPASSDHLAIASYFSSSSVHAGVVTNSPHYQVGDTVIISGLVFDGPTPVTGATVTAAIGDPTQSEADPVQIALLDSGSYDAAPGDGIYTGAFTIDRVGQFSIAIRATGANGAGVMFSRVADMSFKVTRPLASFVSFRDAGVDDDGNGLIDRVTITATVDVRQAGSYRFNVTLAAANGAEAKANGVALLQAGTQQISASFPASDIYGLNANGPYQIKNALLTFQDDPDHPVASYRELAGSTAAYLLSSMQPPPLFFAGDNSEWREDKNRNGKSDSLTIETEVRVATEGNYAWSGSLVDSLGNTIQRVNSSDLLTAGSNYIRFTFDGNKIGQNGVNGPYSLRLVTISGAGDSANVYHLYTTKPYLVSEFEGATPSALEINSVTATDVGGNGNSTIEPGEDGALVLQLTNRGGYGRAISATLTTSTPGVTIINGASAYPDIASTASATNSTPFTFRTSNQLPGNTEVHFTLTVTSLSGAPQTLQFSLKAGSIAQGKIAYAGVTDGGSNIWVMEADGSNKTKITTSGQDNYPAWSPDGTKITFTSQRLGGNGDIFVMNSDGSNQINLTSNFTNNRQGSNFQSKWSPDGTKLAFVSNRDGNAEIYVMNSDGSIQVNLTRNAAEDTYPTWSPDGTKIAFVSLRSGDPIYQIYVMNADGSGQTNITNNRTYNQYPAWSPDGSRIAYITSAGIYVMNSDGTGQTKVGGIVNDSFPSYSRWPAWSPDGTRIVFSNNRYFLQDDIYVMNADGSNVTQLTTNPVDDYQPSWQPPPKTPAPTPTPPAANTPVGSNVPVQVGALTLTFSNVYVPGYTRVIPIDPSTAGTPPAGYVTVGNLAFEITTTALVSWPVTIRFNVPTITDPAEFSALRVLHGEHSILVDRTILPPNQPAPDFASKTISAKVNSFSPFVIATTRTKASTTTVVASSPASYTYGQQVTFTATVSSSGSTPSGSVEFFDGSKSLGIADLNNGSASLSVPTLDAGTHNITATYAETGSYLGSTSAVLAQSVGQTKPTIEITGGTFTYDGGPHSAKASVVGVNGENLGSASITYDGSSTAPVAAGSYGVTASFGGNTNYEAYSATATLVIEKAVPSLTWNTPASIVYGTMLDSGQLNATAPVPGNITYDPPAGTILGAGSRTLTATFTPADLNNYASTAASVQLNVVKATPTISWSDPSEIVYGTQLGGAQLNATASVPGTLTYTPGAGTLLGAGAAQTLSVSFTPNDAANYDSATTSVKINVTKAPLTVTADNAVKLLGAPNPAFTVRYSGFVAGQGPSALSGELIFTTAATANSPVGGYPVTPGGLTSTNYSINFVSGMLSVAYKVNLLYDTLRAVKSGSTIPIKLQLTDVNGVNVSSANIVVRAVNVLQASTSATETLADSGNANPDDNFRYDPTLGGTGGYIFNLSTRGYPNGTFILSLVAGSDPLIYAAEFQVRQ